MPLWPEPLNGGQRRIAATISALVPSCDVTLLTPGAAEERASMDEWEEAASLKDVIFTPVHRVRQAARWAPVPQLLRSLGAGAPPLEISEKVSASLLDTLVQVRESGRIDVVWACRTHMAEAARMAGFEQIILDVDDFDSALFQQDMESRGRYGRRLLHRLMWRQLRAYELSLTKRFGAVVISTEEDRALLGRGSAIVSCLKNGVTLPTTLPSESTGQCTYRLLFVGTLAFPPNVDAVRWFVLDILPLLLRIEPRARVTIAGRGPAPSELRSVCDGSPVEIVESPLNLAPHYAAADVVVAPIRLGHGSKIKVLEAMGYAKPLIATSAAVRGHDVRDGVHALVADDPQAFAAAIDIAFRDATLRRRLSAAGLELARSLSWQATMQEAPELVSSLVSTASRA
jgi:glycosyltransferase involved in cell wall biosynthesis